MTAITSAITSAIASFNRAADLSEHNEMAIGKLKDERIEAAFGAPPSDTRPIVEEMSSKTARASSFPTFPRGLRLIAKPGRNRLAGFITEQRWQGYVTSVSEQTFTAIVYDVSTADNDEIEEVELEHMDVHSLMRNLITPGAVFFWDIGYEIDPGEQRNRKSIISFPTIHRDTKKSLEAVKIRAHARFDKLGWGRSEFNSIEPEEHTSS